MRNLELPGRSPSHAPSGMAATSHILSTQTAVSILQAGGNAMDAAIAACAVQCVVEPGSTSIGGDNFCLYSPGGGEEIVAFNGSGKAPGAATATKLRALGYDRIERDAHSVTVPGAVDAWCRLHADHGKLPLAEVLGPAIAYARDGYPVSSRVYRDFNAEAALLTSDPGMAEVFLVEGKIPAIGALMKQPKLAATLQKIADEGREGFYAGAVAQDMVDYLRSKGGLHTMQDFAETKGDYEIPIKADFRGHTVWQCPPNGQGVIALLLLNMASQMPVDKQTGPITADRMHREIEACRMGYYARNMFVADPRFAPVPVDEMLSMAYAEKLYSTIDMAKAQIPPVDMPLPQHKDTVYISVVDKDRNACSFINTTFWTFGSGLISPNTGVLFQNRGMGFVLDDDHPNVIEPGKRPLHTILPAMTTQNGKVALCFGVMGGHYQAFGHLHFLSRYLDYGMDIQEAMDAPRFMPDPFTGDVEMEGAVPQEIQNELRRRGHRLVAPRAPVGGSQAIHIDWDQGLLTGGSDPRKDGCAIGY